MSKATKHESPFRRLIALAVVDIGPFRRHRDFRLLFMGQFVSLFGNAITAVAVPYQVYTLTHSPSPWV